MAILALVIIVATFYLGDTLLTSTVPQENRDILNVAMGMILSLSSTVVGYYFGSSKSSSDKTKLFEDGENKFLEKKEKDVQLD
jgi:hypothetical protein